MKDCAFGVNICRSLSVNNTKRSSYYSPQQNNTRKNQILRRNNSQYVKKPKALVPSSEPLSTYKILKSVNGTPTFVEVEKNDEAWGFLVVEMRDFITLDKRLDSRLEGESAGYVIGNHPSCDIVVNHFQPDLKRHAFIHCRSRTEADKQDLAAYIHDLSSYGIWVNGKKIDNQIVEIFSRDVIHFMDPNLYEAKVNPCYKFIKPITKTLQVAKFESLYKTIRKIGEGAFGDVYLGICTMTGKKVAIKKIRNSVHHLKEKHRLSLLREISVCMAFPIHPCIIQVNKVFEENNIIYIVMEYGENGDLFANISEPEPNTSLQEYQIKIVFDQIAHAVSYLHELDIVHRDVKLENVIMCDRKKLTAKLCDFGLSTFINREEPLWTVCGTVMYAAPELLEAGDTKMAAGYGPAVDIWSLGVLLFTALANSTPFPQLDETEKGKENLKQCIRKGEFKFDHPIWNTISPDAQDLIQCMMRKDVNERYTISQVLAHPWLQNIETSVTREAGVSRNRELVEYLNKGANSSSTIASSSSSSSLSSPFSL